MKPDDLDGHQALLTIDLDALKANWTLLASRSAPAACAAVVKADAYGVGIERAVPALARAGCRTFFVAHLVEGVRARTALREVFGSDEDFRIFLLHGLQPGPVIHTHMLTYRLGPVLGSLEEIEVWRRETSSDVSRPPSAIQVDTGMNRIGLPPRDLLSLSSEVARNAGAVLLMSHLASAENPADPSNAAQLAAFETIRAAFSGLAASLANSSGIFLPGKVHYDLVRPGYALYGGNPCPGSANPMQAVVGLRAAILQTRTIEAGETVGYNGRWIARRPTRLATVGIGYADGLPRNADTLGAPGGPHAIVDGIACPLVGRVSMDLIVVDVTDAPDACVALGAPLDLLTAATGIDDLARSCGTTGYEILTNLGRRYARRYVESSGSDTHRSESNDGCNR